MPRFPHRTPVYLTADIRQIEAHAFSQPERPPLMERAGRAAAAVAQQLARSGGKVTVLAGPGNNGGDAFVVARHLKQAWFNVEVVFAGDSAKLPPDAASAFAAWRDAGGSVLRTTGSLRDCDLIVDGLFGIGLARELAGYYAELVSAMNAAACPVLSLDVPSGLDSDTGRVLGSAVRATHTVTFIGLKAGMLTLEGPEHCGAVEVASLGLDAVPREAAAGQVIGAEVLDVALPRRRVNTHKGDYGSVGIIGGADGMVGAALLAGRGALKLGAGRTYVGLIARDAPLVDMAQAELMLKPAPEIIALGHLTALAVGPGLGTSTGAERLLQAALASRLPLVLDADALNLLGLHANLRETLAAREAPTILTPHPAEAGRLLGRATPDVQRDRVASTVAIAATYRCGIVLKGAGSVCAWPDGTWSINTSGNPGMATAGMGDVLTGMLAALLSQRVEARTALEAAVYLHGAAADRKLEEGCGPVGLTAGEVIDAARALVNARAREPS